MDFLHPIAVTATAGTPALFLLQFELKLIGAVERLHAGLKHLLATTLAASASAQIVHTGRRRLWRRCAHLALVVASSSAATPGIAEQLSRPSTTLLLMPTSWRSCSRYPTPWSR